MADKKNVKNTELTSLIKGARVTEKAAVLSGQNAYTFNVDPRATKIQIKQAIEQIYGVKPVKVSVSAIPYKTVRRRTGTGKKGGGKKAVVYLKKGDSIELF